jgi:two-component sensor histidine kinase/ABC-type amino acid transport substrate-binding protein
MRPSRRILALAIASISFLADPLLLSSAQSAERAVRIGVFPAAPLVFVDGDRPDGLFIDLVKEFSRELNWRPYFVSGTWSQLLGQLERAEIDLLPAVGYTDERSRIYDFSRNPVFIDSGVVFTKRGVALHTIFDLEGKRIAALRGSTFTAGFSLFIASFGIKCEIDLTDDNEEVMRRIASGDSYAGVCIYSLGTELAKKYPVVVTPISFSPIALEFAVPKGRNGDLIAGIDGIMGSMVDDPTSPYSRSFEKWTVARQPARIPFWIWIGIAAIALAGSIFAAASLILRREVRRKTEHLRAEIAQHEEAEKRLTRSLHENETLIRELYHRTKNTLQLVRSFISLEALELGRSEDIDRLVRKTSDRIDSIALVHQMLYKSRDLSRISIKDYMAEMSDLVLRSNEVDSGRIALAVSADDRDVLLDTAIPFGLILNELITNSIKHAFPDGREGRIEIVMRNEGESRVSLEYADDGVGVPEPFDFRGRKSLGLQLIFRMVESQMKGSVSISSGRGLRYRMIMSTDLYEARV